MIDVDFYGEVVNTENTYKYLAELMTHDKAVLIGWTDGLYTHYDIFLKWGVLGSGTYQRGITKSDLFVCIMGVGAFGFKIGSDKAAGYVAEKLFNGKVDTAVERITDLINGVIKYIKTSEFE